MSYLFIFPLHELMLYLFLDFFKLWVASRMSFIACNYWIISMTQVNLLAVHYSKFNLKILKKKKKLLDFLFEISSSFLADKHMCEGIV